MHVTDPQQNNVPNLPGGKISQAMTSISALYSTHSMLILVETKLEWLLLIILSVMVFFAILGLC